MAIWQFDFHIIPRAAVETHFGTSPVTIHGDEYNRVDWWRDYGAADEIFKDLSNILPPAQSWDPKQEAWGTLDGDRIDLLKEKGEIKDLFCRIDVRNLSMPLVNRIATFARARHLLFLTEAGHVLRPSVRELLAAIRNSPSFAFVQHPERYVDGL